MSRIWGSTMTLASRLHRAERAHCFSDGDLKAAHELFIYGSIGLEFEKAVRADDVSGAFEVYRRLRKMPEPVGLTIEVVQPRGRLE